MATRLAPTFPQELFDCIIDYSFYDKKALRTFSLVCKQWLPASRYHLFFQIRLRDDNWDLIQGFLKAYARQLVIPVILPRNLLDSSLPQITCLALRAIGRRHELNLGLSAVFPHIKELQLRDAFATIYDTIRFVCSFPELKSVTLDFGGAHERGVDARSLHLPNTLKSLTLYGNVRDVLRAMEWLESAETSPRLVVLRILSLSARHMALTSRFLPKIASTLQDLYLMFNIDTLSLSQSPEPRIHLLTMEHTSLQSLSLFVQSPGFYEHHLAAYLQNTNITEVTIIADQYSLAHDQSSWLSLDKTIVESLKKYPRPKFMLRTRIQCVPGTDIDKLIWSSLPLCIGIGVVNCVDEYRRLALVQTSILGPVSYSSFEYLWRVEKGAEMVLSKVP